ncbi:hypothetical protein IL38_23690 [Actinopolyspora erythraea]|uniref:Uncharacterized protein n=1 Tax=Actinopolyspora erythraea TaxID=414996 RepID=A0ABR4WY38_9ACTN|nr:hypothetical protein [Actinopolyspora erythraea]KGI79316.1 hypothetical protein IL38_23690 [Actinopolyspora erythraea]
MTAQQDAIWVVSERVGDGQGYALTVHYSDDVSQSLEASEAVTYAATVTRAAVVADSEAAVYQQLTTALDLAPQETAPVITALREQRPESYTAGPLTITPGISAFTGRGFLRCAARDRSWQWDIDGARQHARQVLDVASGVEFDRAYEETLVSLLGVDVSTASAVVYDVAAYRET